MEIIVFRKKLALALLLLFLNTVLFPPTWYAPGKNSSICCVPTIEAEAPGSFLELFVETCWNVEKDTPFCPQAPQEEETSTLSTSNMLEEYIHSERSINVIPFVVTEAILPDCYYQAYHLVHLDIHIQPPETPAV